MRNVCQKQCTLSLDNNEQSTAPSVQDLPLLGLGLGLELELALALE